MAASRPKHARYCRRLTNMHQAGSLWESLAFAALLLAAPGWAAQDDPCSSASTSDVRLTLAVKDGRAVFQKGEIIPLVLSFTSTAKDRYQADVRNYDRSGRLGIEYYCVEPEAPDPLASYFKYGSFIGGGLGGTRKLDASPFTAEADLNEWRSLAPGHYRVYAISYRVWRPPDPGERTPYGRIAVVVRSNVVELDVKPADAAWQREQIRSARQVLAGASSPEAVRSAARVLRFLSTKESTRQLARRFSGLNAEQPGGWDLMFGLFGSPYRKLAIDSMREQIAVPDHPITSEFLNALVNLQVSADPAWDPPPTDQAQMAAAQEFRKRRQEHTQALTRAETEAAAAALARKTGRARALTLNGLLMAGGGDPELAGKIRPALIAAWPDLPPAAQPCSPIWAANFQKSSQAR